MTKIERLEDERVLAAIIAGAEVAKANGRNYGPHSSHDLVSGHCNGYGGFDGFYGPCCAIGLGLLFVNLPIDNLAQNKTALRRFAEAHDVSLAYALGLSEGFENDLDGDVATNTSEMSRWSRLARTSKDWRRGFEVGKAAFQALFQS